MIAKGGIHGLPEILGRGTPELTASWQRKRGREIGLSCGEAGSVSAIQRMGSAVNLHVHVHTILPDGFFVPSSDGSLRCASLPPPRTGEVEKLLQRMARCRTDRLARTYEQGGDGLALDPDLAALYETLPAAVSEPPGRLSSSALKGFDGAAGNGHLPAKPLYANLAGFSLHAARSVPAHDRQALQRLLRYTLRPPFAQNRLSLSPDRQVVYQLRRPWVGGAQEVILDPLDFLRRLTALLLRPCAHAIRYHGCFAGRSTARPLLPKPPLCEQPDSPQPRSEGAGSNQDGPLPRPAAIASPGIACSCVCFMLMGSPAPAAAALALPSPWSCSPCSPIRPWWRRSPGI